MMAKQHVNFAVASYVTVVGALSREWEVGSWSISPISTTLADWPGSQPLRLLLSAILIGGWALVPDADHHNSTLIRRLGWLGKLIYPVVRLLSGGHRKGMHSVFLPIIVVAFFWLVDQSTRWSEYMVYFVALMIWFMGAIIARFVLPRRLGRSKDLVTFSLGALILIAFHLQDDILDGHWLPISAAIGCVLHVVGDLLTDGKVYIFHPLSDITIRLPMTFPTGGFFETYVLSYVFLGWSLLVVSGFIAYPLISTLGVS